MKYLRSKTLFVLLISAVLFGSCGVDDYFAEYRDVNLISDLGFESGSWTVEYSDASAAYAYMTFTAESGESYSGSPAYRLKVPNLMPNGDFEQGLSANWELSPTHTPDANSLLSDSTTEGTTPISGTSLYFNVIPADYICFNLNDTALGLIDTAGVNVQYQFFFDYLNFNAPENLWFQFSSYIADNNPTFTAGTDNADDDPLTFVFNTTTASFPYSFPSSLLEENANVPGLTYQIVQDPSYFSIGVRSLSDGSGELQNGQLDNLIIQRVMTPFITLEVPYSSGEDAPILLSGTYQFSVAVKSVGAADITPSSPNEYHITSLRININDQDDESPTSEYSGIVPSASVANEYIKGGESGSWSDWTVLTCYVDIQVDVQNEISTPVLKLNITPKPTSISDWYVGNVLLADPQLYYLPEGIPE